MKLTVSLEELAELGSCHKGFENFAKMANGREEILFSEMIAGLTSMLDYIWVADRTISSFTEYQIGVVDKFTRTLMGLSHPYLDYVLDEDCDVGVDDIEAWAKLYRSTKLKEVLTSAAAANWNEINDDLLAACALAALVYERHDKSKIDATRAMLNQMVFELFKMMEELDSKLP
jgi:hypothetical protein